jgi:hypothetical protein
MDAALDTARNARFEQLLKDLDLSFEDDIRPGANYELAVEHDAEIYISGMIPRMRGAIVVTGRVGADVTPESAICHTGERPAFACGPAQVARLPRPRQAYPAHDGVCTERGRLHAAK